MAVALTLVLVLARVAGVERHLGDPARGRRRGLRQLGGRGDRPGHRRPVARCRLCRGDRHVVRDGRGLPLPDHRPRPRPDRRLVRAVDGGRRQRHEPGRRRERRLLPGGPRRGHGRQADPQRAHGAAPSRDRLDLGRAGAMRPAIRSAGPAQGGPALRPRLRGDDGPAQRRRHRARSWPSSSGSASGLVHPHRRWPPSACRSTSPTCGPSGRRRSPSG